METQTVDEGVKELLWVRWPRLSSPGNHLKVEYKLKNQLFCVALEEGRWQLYGSWRETALWKAMYQPHPVPTGRQQPWCTGQVR